MLVECDKGADQPASTPAISLSPLVAKPAPTTGRAAPGLMRPHGAGLARQSHSSHVHFPHGQTAWSSQVASHGEAQNMLLPCAPTCRGSSKAQAVCRQLVRLCQLHQVGVYRLRVWVAVI